MLLDEELLEDIKGKIEASRKQTEVYEGMLAYLMDKMNMKSSGSNSAGKAESASDEPISLQDLNIPTKPHMPTFKDEITKVVKLMGNQEFTVAHVIAALVKRGVKVNGKQPGARVSKLLGELQLEGIVEKTFKGIGNVPHRFKYLGF